MRFLLGSIAELPSGSADAGMLRMLANDMRRSFGWNSGEKPAADRALARLNRLRISGAR
jgi:hypothetical protein